VVRRIKHRFEFIKKCFSVYQWISFIHATCRPARPGTMFPRRFRTFHNKRSVQLSVLCPLYSPKLLVVVEHNSLIQPHAAKIRSTSTDPAIKQLCGLECCDVIVDTLRLKDLLTKSIRFLHQHFGYNPDLQHVEAENFLNCT